MSNQFNHDNDTFPIIEQQQPQLAPTHTPTQERAQYLKNLREQAMILHRELIARLIFLGDYIDYAFFLIAPSSYNWCKAINSAQALLNSVLGLVDCAGVLASLGLQQGSEDGQRLDSLTLAIGGYVGQTGWMYLGGRDYVEVQAWVGEAENLLGNGQRAIACLEETVRKVEEIQAGVEGYVIGVDA
ncbi:hypothetical protein HOY80DRAFT_474829 [Tuber brumale]|nr:hypothetical protein HOY80DRAFT_474829 [Tuber brumale]